MVRLLTHNLLACHAKPCTDASNNFPLSFTDAQILIRPVDYNKQFLTSHLPRIHYKALRETAVALGVDDLPEQLPSVFDDGEEEEFLKKLHHVLLEVTVEEGAMVCPNCGHVFPIKQGIPNMILAPHETA